MPETIRPFSCGTQAEDWMSSNCDRCTKQAGDRYDADCPIHAEILDAWFGDGEVSAEVARRMGYLDADGDENRRYIWPCSEVEWTEEWKAECRRSRTMRISP